MPRLREWLPENHLAFFVSDLIDQLDLSAITSAYEHEERGYPPYDPAMLTKVLVYGYGVGVLSSRKIQQRLVEDVALRVAGNQPDFRMITDFRKTHLTAWRGFFEQVLRLARELGAPRVGRAALEGSKVKANGSKHKAMSYGRMRENQRRLREEVNALLAQADAAEDAECRPDRHGDELPAELQRRESRLKQIREAKRALEARAKDKAAAAGKSAKSAKPDSKAQHNFTNPESRIMQSPRRIRPSVQPAGGGGRVATDRGPSRHTGDQRQEAADAVDHHHRTAGGPHAHTGACGRRLWLRLELDRDRRHTSIDAQVETWRAAGALPSRAVAEDGHDRRSDVSQAASEDWWGGLCGAQSARGSGDWVDQAGPWFPTILLARIREGPR
jgi:transposase